VVAILEHFFEVLDDLVEANLNPNWDTDICFFERDENFVDIRQSGFIEGRRLFVGSYNYLAEKNI
jgi:hypothetical protein